MKKNFLITILLLSYALVTSFVINPLFLGKLNNNDLYINLHSILLYLVCIVFIIIFCKPVYEIKNLRVSKKRQILCSCLILFILIGKTFFIIYVKNVLSLDSLQDFKSYTFISCFLAGFAEELLFRFLIYSKILKKYLYKIFSIIIVSLIFALCHGQLNLTLIPLFLMGFLYTILYEIWPNVFVIGLFHSLWNILSLI